MQFLIPAIIAGAVAIGGYFFSPDTYDKNPTEGENLGATSFPTSLDNFTNPTAGNRTDSPSHAEQHSNANDAIEAIQAKLGVNGSAVTTTHDYKLSGVTGTDKAASLTGTEVFTNKTLTSPTLTSPTIATGTLSSTTLNTRTTMNGTTTFNATGSVVRMNLGNDATGDLLYRNSVGNLTRLGLGSAGQVLKVVAGLPAWDASGGGTTVNVFEGTASGASALYSGISQTANDVLVVFAEFVETTDCNAGANNDLQGDLSMWRSGPNSTTTLRSTYEGSGAGTGCSATTLDVYTSTTTETVNVRADFNSGTGNGGDNSYIAIFQLVL